MKKLDPKHLEADLKGIRHLLSHLHGEVTTLEESYTQVLHVLRKMEGIVDQAAEKASIDDLTKLLRKNAFFQRWYDLLEECKKVGEDCGILMVDIDHFKAVNDTHGHLTGDEVLKSVAGLLKQFESPSCFCGRFGGEEFAVAIKGKDPEILGIAEMIRRRCERLHGPVMDRNSTPDEKVQWKCTLSVGMASARGPSGRGYDATRLLHAADQALYTAKKKGRNQVRAA
jgi:diguanylate cyclase